MAAFMGMRGTGDFTTNSEPESWQEGVLYQQPNGIAPLFAMLSMFDRGSVNASKYHWFTYSTPLRGLDVTAGSAIYTDEGLSSAYSYSAGATTGTNFYLKCTEDFAKQVNPGHRIITRMSNYVMADVRHKVLSTKLNGASSYILVECLEDDDNASTPSATAGMQAADRFVIYTNAHPQGGDAPSAISYDEVEYDGLTQIIKTPLVQRRRKSTAWVTTTTAN